MPEIDPESVKNILSVMLKMHAKAVQDDPEWGKQFSSHERIPWSGEEAYRDAIIPQTVIYGMSAAELAEQIRRDNE